MKQSTKKQRRHLRKLSDQVYVLKLNEALEDLRGKFESWKSKTTDCFELSDAIHEFHDGISRDLYKQFVMTRNEQFSVAYGVREGLLAPKDIDDSCRAQIVDMAEHFQGF